MAQDLYEEFGEQLESFTMRPGRTGAFEVKANGALLFSKLREARFPSSQELVDAIRSRVLGRP